MERAEHPQIVPISVLMSTYERDDPEQLDLAVKSIFEQTTPPKQLVIVAGGNLPPTIEALLERYSHGPIELLVLRQRENLGLGSALQFGLEHTSEELVARMDSDDICFPHRFEKQYAYIRANPDVDLLSAWHAEFEFTPNEINALNCTPESDTAIKRMLPWRNGISHPTMMFQRDRILAIGGYRPFRRSEDHDLWLRAASAGLKFHCLQTPLVYMRTNHAQRVRRTGTAYAFTSLTWRFQLFREGHLSTLQFLVSGPLFVVFHLVPASMKNLLYRFVRRSVSNGPTR